jgi:hypothetical protein
LNHAHSDAEWENGMTATGLAIWTVASFAAVDDVLDFEYEFQRTDVVQVADVTISSDPRLKRHNLGGMQTIDVWQDKGVSLIRFEVSSLPSQAIVKRAKLSLYCLSVGFSQEEISREVSLELREATRPWTEGDGTNKVPRLVGASVGTYDGKNVWPNASAVTTAGARLATTLHRSGQVRWYEWDLPPRFVADHISKVKPNHGVMLVGASNGKAISFASSEYANRDLRPKLSLTLAFPIRKMVESALGEDPPREGILRVSKAQALRYPENNLITVNVDWAIKTPVLF